MDCIDLFKKAAAALQTDPRYLELDAARVRAQRIRVERGGGDGGRVRAAACEGKLILQEAVLELVVLDGEAGTAVCGAKRVAAGNRTFQPREFQLEIQPVLIGENEGIADGLAGGAGRAACPSAGDICRTPNWDNVPVSPSPAR